MTVYDPVDAWLQQRAGLSPRDMDLGLERVAEVWARLDGRRPAPHVITVGGTNGKGSCVALLEAILRAAGYRVGCYTSPHLVHYAERVRVDGAPVSSGAILAALRRVAEVRGDTPLTYFEMGTLAAFDLFVRAELDVAVLEVGLGGRLDAVNLVDADAALVASVGLDHQDWLGPDREAIGREKAGIFRAGRPAICGDPAPPASLLDYARAVRADLQVSGRDFRCSGDERVWHWFGRGAARRALPLPALRGRHQLANAKAVLAVLASLRETLPVDQGAVREGLLGVRLAGRFDVRRDGEVTWVLDVGHNPAAAAAVAENLRAQFVPGRTRAVLAMLRGKDVAGVVRALDDQVDEWHAAAFADARALAATELRAQLQAAVTAGTVVGHADVPAALAAVRRASRAGDRVLVLGSFVTVGAALRWWEEDR